MDIELAPIILFVYNRLEHTKQTIEALKKNDLAIESNLYIFSDGPKSNEDVEKVASIRGYIKQIQGFKNIIVHENVKNLGLAKSIITGVSEVIEKYGKVIVLEDDLITKSNFLLYMNEALNYYENYDKVYSITGYSFTNDSYSGIDETYFLRITSSWSWATWKDRWQQLDVNDKSWHKLQSDKYLRHKYNYDNSYNYFRLLKLNEAKKINSWAIKWYWTMFKKEGITLYPKNTLVLNEGFDGSGTHCGISMNYGQVSEKLEEFNFTNEVYEKQEIRKTVVQILNNKKKERLRNILSSKGISFIFKRLKKTFFKKTIKVMEESSFD